MSEDTIERLNQYEEQLTKLMFLAKESKPKYVISRNIRNQCIERCQFPWNYSTADLDSFLDLAQKYLRNDNYINTLGTARTGVK